MKFPKVQGPRIQHSRRHRAAAAFVDEWQIRIIAIGPFYLRLAKRPQYSNKVAGQVGVEIVNSPDMMKHTRTLEGKTDE